ncbi:MAG: DNA-processing protein DprA [Armatimonadota bacterium]
MVEIDREELLASMALACAELSARAWLVLRDKFGSSKGILAAEDLALAAVRGVSAQARARVETARKKLPEMPDLLDRLTAMGATAVPFTDPLYPPLLKQIADPPGLLFVRGELTEQDRFAVAIVGSRSPRPYGVQMARRLASDLASAGLTIVSGGARGIDGSAHDAAIRAGGRTIAVLGSGIDVAYPSEHRELFNRIAVSGALLSEFPPGAPPESWRFPRRNRIISGLSRGVIVCDAPEDSGSLITATCAAEQSREVFAVPGNVDTGHNRGAHRLLKEGAKLVESAEDVLEEFGIERSPERKAPVERPRMQVTPDEMRILELLDLEPVPLDVIIEKTALPPSDVAGLLTFLEMKRLVKRLAGPSYVRVVG